MTTIARVLFIRWLLLKRTVLKENLILESKAEIYHGRFDDSITALKGHSKHEIKIRAGLTRSAVQASLQSNPLT